MSVNPKGINKILDEDPGWLTGRVLDVRPQKDFQKGHLRKAVSIPLAKDCDPAGIPSLILPPRHQPLLVVGNPDQAVEPLARELESRGRTTVTWLIISAEQWASLPGELLATGPSRDHLWAPPPWLSNHLKMLPPPALGPVLDLGCGSGRAAVFLAERGYQVTGLDWQAEARDMGRQLAADRGTNCFFREADLRNPDNLPEGSWSIILNFRFLQREMLARFGNLLVSGGVALVRTFREAPGYEGHPQRKHRLQPGELFEFFPAGQFEVLAHGEDFDDDGRPAAGIVARRR